MITHKAQYAYIPDEAQMEKKIQEEGYYVINKFLPYGNSVTKPVHFLAFNPVCLSSLLIHYCLKTQYLALFIYMAITIVIITTIIHHCDHHGGLYL
jgi:hypothetical protein